MLHISILHRLPHTRNLPPRDPSALPRSSTSLQLLLRNIKTTRRLLLSTHIPQVLVLHVAELAFLGGDEVGPVGVGSGAEVGGAVR